MKYFLDTNICIYFLKGMYPVLLSKIMSFQPDEIKIPSIVKAELLYGAEKSVKKKENKEKILQFLIPFEITSFDSSACEYYSEIRAYLEKNGTIIGPNDLLIAATVLSKDGILVTNNTKEFNRIKKLKLENWIL